MTDRYQYKIEDVTDAKGLPEFAFRTSVEQAAVRFMANQVLKEPILSGCEVGCGYGRMLPALQEFCQVVYGYEREPELIAKAKELYDGSNVSIMPIEMPTYDMEGGPFSFVMTFTFLQHLQEEEVGNAIHQIKRITDPTGFVLLVEETDGQKHCAPGDLSVHGTTGRSVEEYQALMKPFELIGQMPRPSEPNYPRANVGTMMLFQNRG